jgi:ATP-dependent protease ClpP protease subunit
MKKKNPASYIMLVAGEINWDTIHEAYEDISKRLTDKPFEHLILVIASPGGEVDAAWCLYTLLDAMPFAISTVACGRVYSASINLFLLGTQRYALPNTFFLFHPTTHESFNKGEATTYALEEAVKGSIIDRNHFATVIREKTGMEHKDLIEALVKPNSSMYLTANQAKSYKIVTNLITKLTDIEVGKGE